MPAAKQGSDELCAYTHKIRRERHHPQSTRRAFYRMAINLCHAVEAVHAMGHIIGDFNPNNILCRENGAVTLIDTDSFSILEPCSTSGNPQGEASAKPAPVACREIRV